MTSAAFDHGSRLSDEEYDCRIVALQDGLPAVPSRRETLVAERAEFDLAVAHRLGEAFPPARWEALWRVHRSVRRRPLWTMAKRALRGLVSFDTAREGRRLARAVVDAYADVLTHAELESFFGVDEVRDPSLPVDDEPRQR